MTPRRVRDGLARRQPRKAAKALTDCLRAGRKEKSSRHDQHARYNAQAWTPPPIASQRWSWGDNKDGSQATEFIMFSKFGWGMEVW